MISWKNKKLDARERAKMVRHWGSYTVLILCLFAMTFFGVCSPQGDIMTGSGPQGSAVRVGGEVVSDLEFKRAYQSIYDRYRQQLRDNFDPAQFQLSTITLEQLISQRLSYLTAKNLGVGVSENEIIDMLKQNQMFQDDKGKFSPDYFREFLRRNVYTEKSFMESLQRDLAVRKFMEIGTAASFVSDKTTELDYQLNNTKLNFEYLKLTPSMVNATITDAQIEKYIKENAKEIQDYFKAHESEYDRPEEAKARHILISYQGARNASADAGKRTKVDAQKIAESILADLKKSGADFNKIASAKTDDPSGKASGGDLGWFTPEKMVPEFSKAAFALNKGEISGLVESPFGFHIIKLEDKKEAHSVPYDTAKKEIAKQKIKTKDATALLEQKAKGILDQLKAGQNISGQLAQDKLQWQSTGEVSLLTNYVAGLGSDQHILGKVLTMNKPGQIFPDVLGKENKYIVRLKTFLPANMSAYDAKKEEEKAKGIAYRQASQLLKLLEQKHRKSLDENGKIWISKSHQNFDRGPKNEGG